ncbi:hypothetical protein ACCS45_03975 [Rhizobium ruizarguesonis]
MDIEEFLAWDARQSERFEFVNGKATSLEHATQQQSLLKTDIISALRPMVHGTSWRVIANIRLVVSAIHQVWYPAVIVDSGPLNPVALEPARPILVIDVGRTRIVTAEIPFAYILGETDDNIAAARNLLQRLLQEETPEC